MEARLTQDIVRSEVLPQVPSTDLLQVSKAYPHLMPEAKHIIESRQHKFRRGVAKDECGFTHLKSRPLISPTGTFVVLWDLTDRMLQLRDTKRGNLITERQIPLGSEIEYFQMTDDEKYIFVNREESVTVVELEKSYVNGQLTIRMESKFHIVLRLVHPYENYDPDRVFLAATHFISGVTEDGTWTMVRVGYCFAAPDERNATLKIDWLTGDMKKHRRDVEKQVHYNYEFHTHFEAPEGDIIKDVTEVEDPTCEDYPPCTTITIKTVLFPRVALAEASLKPVRVVFPPEAARQGAILVNPTMEDGGPWTKTIHDTEGGNIFETRLSPSKTMITVVRKENGGVWIERYRVTDASFVQKIFMALPEDEEPVALLESRDERICLMMYGTYDSLVVDTRGWVVGDIHRGGVVTVPFDQRVQRTPGSSSGEIRKYSRNLDLTEDGQFITAIHWKGVSVPIHRLDVIDVATGEILNTLETGPRNDIEGDGSSDWTLTPSTEPCDHFMSKIIPGRIVMIRRSRELRAYTVLQFDWWVS